MPRLTGTEGHDDPDEPPSIHSLPEEELCQRNDRNLAVRIAHLGEKAMRLPRRVEVQGSEGDVSDHLA